MGLEPTHTAFTEPGLDRLSTISIAIASLPSPCGGTSLALDGTMSRVFLVTAFHQKQSHSWSRPTGKKLGAVCRTRTYV